jgi:hypothetical protein
MRYKYHWLGLAFLALGIIRLWIYARHGKHFLCLLPLILAGSVSGHTLTVFNFSGTNSGYANSATYSSGMVFTPGVTVIDLEAGNNLYVLDNILSSSLNDSYDWYCAIYTGAHYSTMYHYPPPQIVEDVQSTRNYGAAVGAGIGMGFLWFGFGWKIRLARNIVRE